MKLSIIGMGFVGKAIYHTFSPYFDIKIYDKYQKGYHELEETIKHSDVIFTCVPTPMKEDGSQDMSMVENVIKNVDKYRGNEKKHVIIKSTIIPGTTRTLSKKFPLINLIFNPEFLTERTALFDFINQFRIILGGPDLERVKGVYRVRFPHTPIFECCYEEAELVKYVGNCYFALKISYMNEIYEICDKLRLSYEKIKTMFLADQRVANSGLEVPFQGDMGFGGKCFPKDTNALIKFCEKIDLPLDTIRSAIVVNDRVRVDKDWKNIVGATTDNNYEDKQNE